MAKNQLKFDPTRTTTIRRRFLAEMKSRFRALKKVVRETIDTKDVLGLRPGVPLKLNISDEVQAWRFQSESGKIDSFNTWFQEQTDAKVLTPRGLSQTELGPDAGKPWTAKYVDSAYKKGKTTAYTQVHQAKLEGSPDFYEGSKAEFLRQSFGAPETVAKLQLIATRSFTELKGVTAVMSQQMSRVLVNGLAQGQSPKVIARDMVDTITGIEKKRALVIARTEVIHAHAEGQLDTYEELGVGEVGIMAEWSTAGDAFVCELCQPMEAVILTVKEARGMIPRHPNCRCMFIPANVGEKHGGQAWNDQFIKKKIRASIQAEKPKASAAQARASSVWIGKTKKITSKTDIKLPTVGGKPVNKPIAPGDKVVTPPTPPQKGPVIPTKPTKPPVPAVTAPKTPIAPKPRRRVKPVVQKDVTTTGISRTAKLPFEGSIEILPQQLGGSTGAKLVRITSPTGRSKTYVMKQYSGKQLQVQNEFAANRLYNKMKPGTASKSFIGNYKGKEVLFSEYIDDIDMKALSQSIESTAGGYTIEGVPQLPAASKAIADNFVADSWLANWDAVGLEFDNIGLVKGKWVRVDNGGSLLFRAKGGTKGSLFGNTVGEIDSLRNVSRNPQAAKIFGKMSDKQLLKHMNNFEKRVQKAGGVDSLIDGIIKDLNMPTGQAAEMSYTLNMRYGDILKQRDQLFAKLNAPKIKVSTEAITARAKVNTKNFKSLHQEAINAARIMTDKEKRSIYSFTGHGYEQMNKRVRKGNITPGIKTLDAALEKSPGYRRISVRGVGQLNDTQWENWKSGKWGEVDWTAYSSSSVQPGHEFHSGNHGVAYVIKNKGRQGRYVAPNSSHSGEKELLFKRGSRFKVIGWAKTKSGTQVGKGHSRLLYIEEMDDHAKIPKRQTPPKQYDAKELYGLFQEDWDAAGRS